MLDLETLSTRMNAVVLVIAGIKFDRSIPIKTPDYKDSNVFYRRIDLASYKNLDCHIDPETEAWWKKQSKEVQEEVFGKGKERISLRQALLEFKNWFGNSKQIWSNGNTFDIPILSEWFSKLNIPIPWKFYNSRDTRTIYELAGIKSFDLPQDNLHNALYDCWRQIVGVNKSYLKLGNLPSKGASSDKT